MNRGVSQATVHGGPKSQTQLSMHSAPVVQMLHFLTSFPFPLLQWAILFILICFFNVALITSNYITCVCFFMNYMFLLQNINSTRLEIYLFNSTAQNDIWQKYDFPVSEVCCFCCYCSVAKSCLTFGNPMDCSMPDFPVLHHLPEFPQTHVC